MKEFGTVKLLRREQNQNTRKKLLRDKKRTNKKLNLHEVFTHDLNPDHMVKRKSSQPSYSPDRSHKRPLDFRTRITTRARLYSYFWGLFSK